MRVKHTTAKANQNCMDIIKTVLCVFRSCTRFPAIILISQTFGPFSQSFANRVFSKRADSAYDSWQSVFESIFCFGSLFHLIMNTSLWHRTPVRGCVLFSYGTNIRVQTISISYSLEKFAQGYTKLVFTFYSYFSLIVFLRLFSPTSYFFFRNDVIRV